MDTHQHRQRHAPRTHRSLAAAATVLAVHQHVIGLILVGEGAQIHGQQRQLVFHFTVGGFQAVYPRLVCIGQNILHGQLLHLTVNALLRALPALVHVHRRLFADKAGQERRLIPAQLREVIGLHPFQQVLRQTLAAGHHHVVEIVLHHAGNRLPPGALLFAHLRLLLAVPLHRHGHLHIVVVARLAHIGRGGVAVIGPMGQINAADLTERRHFLGLSRREPALLQPFAEGADGVLLGDLEGQDAFRSDARRSLVLQYMGTAAEGAQGRGLLRAQHRLRTAALATHHALLFAPVLLSGGRRRLQGIFLGLRLIRRHVRKVSAIGALQFPAFGIPYRAAATPGAGKGLRSLLLLLYLRHGTSAPFLLL